MRVAYLIAAALIAGLLAFFLSTQNQQPNVSVQQQAFNSTELMEKFKGTEIYVLKNKVYAGSIVSEASVEIKEWPKNGILPDHIKKDDLPSFIGAAFLTPQAAGTPLLKSNLVTAQSRSTYFSALIRKGMKATSIDIKGSDGYVLGALQPGDYVDIVLNYTMPIDVKKNKQESVNVVETLFKNVRILAIDGQFNFVANPETAQAAKVARSVTLEVTEKIAEILAVASKTGEISVVANPLQLSLYSQFTPEELEKKSVTPPYFIESAMDGDFQSQTVTTDVSSFIARFNPDMTNMIKTGKPSQTEDLEPKNLFIMLGSSKGKQEVKKNISSPEAYNKTEKAQGQEEQQKVFTMRGSLKEKEESRYNATSPQQPINTPIQNTPSPSNP
jgi:Flp pilus assembly protein CpaB